MTSNDVYRLNNNGDCAKCYLYLSASVSRVADVRPKSTGDLIHTLIVFPNAGRDLRMRGLIQKYEKYSIYENAF